MAAALIEPMREIYGVSDKVLAMALSSLLLGAPKKMVLWIEVGGRLIAIDTLVHNFLHRTGILARFNANHLYGAACYRPGGCADIIAAVAAPDRRPAVQSGLSADLSPVRPVRDLAVLQPRMASMFAMAIASTMPNAATTWIAECARCVIGSRCGRLAKTKRDAYDHVLACTSRSSARDSRCSGSPFALVGAFGERSTREEHI